LASKSCMLLATSRVLAIAWEMQNTNINIGKTSVFASIRLLAFLFVEARSIIVAHHFFRSKPYSFMCWIALPFNVYNHRWIISSTILKVPWHNQHSASCLPLHNACSQIIESESGSIVYADPTSRHMVALPCWYPHHSLLWNLCICEWNQWIFLATRILVSAEPNWNLNALIPSNGACKKRLAEGRAGS
jgi:ABC-type polysaccharide/polyol phosphate export permease